MQTLAEASDRLTEMGIRGGVGSFGITVGSMKIEKIDKPGTKLNTDE